MVGEVMAQKGMFKKGMTGNLFRVVEWTFHAM